MSLNYLQHLRALSITIVTTSHQIIVWFSEYRLCRYVYSSILMRLFSLH